MAKKHTLSIADARASVSDLFTPKPWIYWTDFLVSVTVAYSAALIYFDAPMLSGLQIASFLVAGLALYRASLFMHEIVHFRSGEMVAFKVTWNVLAGIPMLVPSFLYESHIAHHNTRHYGTGNDGEYLPLGVGTVRQLMDFLGQMFLLPIFVTLRFLITPFSFLRPSWRRFVLERMSSFVINFSYRRKITPQMSSRPWIALELACSMRAWAIFIWIGAGWAPLERLPMLYSLAIFSLGMNHIRTLVAHRYSSTGETMSHLEQFEDSINITGGPLTELMFPVGLRYHALHHLFPSLPYHNMGKAHRRLLERLPKDSAYHDASYPTFYSALAALVQGIVQSRAHSPNGADLWYQRRDGSVQPTANVADTDDREPTDHRGAA